MIELIQVAIIIIFFTLGISMALRSKLWVEWIKNLKAKGTNGILSLGMINLLLGSIIVTFHWVWEGFATIITAIGILMLCRSFFMLLAPNFVLKMIGKTIPKMNFIISISGFLITIIAVLLFYKLEIQTGLLIVPEHMYYFVKN